MKRDGMWWSAPISLDAWQRGGRLMKPSKISTRPLSGASSHGSKPHPKKSILPASPPIWASTSIPPASIMPKLPRARGDRHIAAFKRAGWVVNHIEGSHYILIKEGNPVHLSIPVIPTRHSVPAFSASWLKKRGWHPRRYCNYFYKKK